MAVAISAEDGGFFAPASTSSLRRSTSQSGFPSDHGAFRKSASASRLHDTYRPIAIANTGSHLQSSTAPIPTGLSFPSTSVNSASAASGAVNLDHLHFDTPTGFHTDTLDFAQYELEIENPPPSPPAAGSYAASSNELELESSTVASTPEYPDVVPKGFDDIALQPAPTHHVDYLSHNWKEEDIWASWKHVTSNRSEYSNSERLENASWRTWAKSKNKLKTVSPEALNWLKDCDVTWLYGPLQTRYAGPASAEPPSESSLSKSASFIDKKPILKKRSMSEAMLQQSLSAASLLKQATAAVHAQQTMAGFDEQRPMLSRAHTTHFAAFPPAPMSRDNSLAGSSDASGLTSPNSEQKHIHFNEQVEQCIAVDAKADEDEDSYLYAPSYEDDSDSDDGIIMKAASRTRPHPPTKPRKPALKASEPKTIASLPSTTLKYREDSPEPHDTAMKHSYRSPVMSPSSSQETLRPSKRSAKFYVSSSSSDDGEDEDEEPSTARSSPTKSTTTRSLDARLSPAGTLQPQAKGWAGAETGNDLKRSTSTSSLGVAESSGMHRTSSGMLMPMNEQGETSENAGVIGRVVDTVNTARDIAHVIWNVGWRR